MKHRLASILAAGLVSIASGEPPAPSAGDPPPDAPQPKEVFPGVLLDEQTKIIELPGKIPIINKPADGTVVFLEQLVCTPDTKEHEVLVVVQAKPSHVHAALLLLGLEPGKPAEWKLEGDKLVPVQPTGPELEIEFIYKDEHGAEHTATPSDWVINFKNRQEHLPQRFPVFAGSAMRKVSNNRERYYADSEGTLIGLATFGTEVIAWPDVFSHESSQHEPEWIASPDMPPLDTPVTVRIKVHNTPEAQDESDPVVTPPADP